MKVNKLKQTVSAVLLNKKGQVLAVSRKHDHNDMGLPGGKVDSTDPSLKEAIKREIKEETGLNINTSTMVRLITMPNDMSGNKYWGNTYLVLDWSGKIETDEPHVVKWTSFDEIIDGSFGTWNVLVQASLKVLGLDIE